MSPKLRSEHLEGAPDIEVSSHFIPLGNTAKLHLRRFSGGKDGKAVMMLHGSIENGRIFYTDSGKGLAPWMAAHGFDVFVPDLQGRGRSEPKVNRHSKHGLKELIEEELPAIFSFIHAEKGQNPMHWMAHSWGGVDLLTFLANPSMPVEVDRMVFFGSKRRIGVRNLRYYWMVGLGWNKLSQISIRQKGYLDAIAYKLGADNISAQTFYDTDMWVRSHQWVHPETGFDYAKALQERELPPILYLTGLNDHVLGHPKDVLRLAKETGPADRYEVRVLSKANGNLRDYGHVDMLTHKDAPLDVYPIALDWIQRSK